MKNTQEGDCNLCTQEKIILIDYKTSTKHKGSMRLIYKFSRDWHNKCGWWSLVIDINSSMILS